MKNSGFSLSSRVMKRLFDTFLGLLALKRSAVDGVRRLPLGPPSDVEKAAVDAASEEFSERAGCG